MRRGFFGRALLAAAGCALTVLLGSAAQASGDATPAPQTSNTTSSPPAAVTDSADSNKIPGADQHWGMLKQYCSKCHTAEDGAGGVALATRPPDEPPEQAEPGEHARRKLRGRLIPPPANPQPDSTPVRSFVGWRNRKSTRLISSHQI